jgi:aldehyde:ferredoxin oxidoreductase
MRVRGGYCFRIAQVDLSTGQAEARPFDEDFALTYVGGRGFNVKLVADNLRRDLDPLGRDNLLVISPGVLNGCYVPSAGKTSFSFISPATGLYGDSNMGGIFGAEVRQAGFDGLAVRGRATKLSYLFIDDGDIRIIENDALAGKSSIETEGLIRDQIGDHEVRVASIGPAGENLVKFACVTSELSRNAGRCGVGTVMGSKNLKAIAVRGSRDIPVADMDRLRTLAKAGFDSLRSHPLFEFWQQQGLMSVIDYVNSIGVMPTYNFRDGVFDRADQVNGTVMEDHYKIGDGNCHLCPMCCSNVCLVKDGRYAGTVVEGPEYETACMFGPNLGVDDFAFVIRANYLCDALGLDTISAGNLIGVMMEAVEKGLLTPADVDGLPLKWGDQESIAALLHKMACREGVGDILADGSRRLMETWPQLKPIISQVKGLEQSAYDGRVAASMALAYGTSDIGAHHARAWPIAKELELGANWTLDDKADIVIYHQTVRPLFDMLGVCRLPWIELGFDETQYAGFYSAVTGVETTFEELLEKSRAIYDLTRAINVARGASRRDDYPPDRVFDDPMLSGPQKGKHASREDYEKLLDTYYQKRGWDAEGNPPVSLEA